MAQKIRNAVTLVVDGREVVAPEGTMLVDAAKHGDIEIPVFCYEPKLGEPVGACRMCLVEIEGIPKLQTACSTPVRDGMVVYTQTDQVQEAQNAVVEFLLVNHPLDCPVCDKGGECPLQDVAMGWGPGKSRFTDPKRHFKKPLELSPLVAIDRERCILCYRCVRFSQEVAEDEQLQLLERGDRSFVGTFDDRPYVAPFHGNITELCPVGALTSYTYRFRARPWDIEDAGSICTLCPSQCNVKFTVRDEAVARVLARDNEDVDDGWLCDKGRYGFQMLASEERITEPMVRAGDGSLTPVSWTEALDTIAKALEGSGDGSAALLGGGTSNEEGWLTQRILRRQLRSPHVASSPNPADPGLLRELARPDLAAKMCDVEYADAILVVGCEPLNEAPILDLRIRKAVRHEGAQLTVASERQSALDGGAADAVRYAPGEAADFLGALAAELGSDSYEGGGPYAKQAAALAETLRAAPDPVIVWGERLWRTPGAVEALFFVARALGIDSKHGAGLLEVPEASNARGLREVGCVPGVGPGLSEAPAGRDAEGIREGLIGDEIKSLLLFDSNPARHFPNAAGWEQALKAADFVVAVSMFDDESAKHANVVLPLESHAEKEGTVTHPDGRLQRLRQNVEQPEGSRDGWYWLLKLAERLGNDDVEEKLVDVFAALTADVPIYSGLTYESIGGTGVRWQERAHASALAGTGTAPAPPTQFRAAGPDRAEGGQGVSGAAPAPAANGDGLVLGTYRDIWASGVTERNPALRFLKPEQKLELAVADAERLGVEHGQRVTVGSNGTSVEARVAIRSRLEPGAAFLIEGTEEQNGNLLANGRPQAIEVRAAE